jgi:tetratricopeptide (TPR) repeat protein
MIWEVCALCDLGRVEEAESVARQLGRLIPGYVKKRSRRCFCMDLAFPAGRIALAKGDGPGAARILEESLRELNGEDYVYRSDHAFLFDLLGDAYERLGRLDLAVEAYARIRGLSQSLDWGAVYARSFYKRGRIYERMGEKGEALRELTRFLEVWKDADAGRPEVEDARARLSALR